MGQRSRRYEVWGQVTGDMKKRPSVVCTCVTEFMALPRLHVQKIAVSVCSEDGGFVF